MENSSSTATLPNSASIQKIRKVSYNPFVFKYIVNYDYFWLSLNEH